MTHPNFGKKCAVCTKPWEQHNQRDNRCPSPFGFAETTFVEQTTL